MTKIAVLGAGIAGCGAAHRLEEEGLRATIFDQNSYPGGHTASVTHPKGFTFDEGPHISFTKDERIQEIFSENVGGKYEVLTAEVNNHWKGHWIKHPAQCNLHGLPTDLLVDILSDFIEAQHEEPGEIRNYADWLLASYGPKFAETFPMEYGLKYHTTEAENMSTDWLGPRLYRPRMEEILRGALSPETEDVHYVDNFRYPSNGGFYAYVEPFFKLAEIKLSHRLVRLDPKNRELHFEDGKTEPYEGVVSSIPLPELIPLIEGVPADVLEASQRLASSICVAVNLGIPRSDISPAHWTYFYDRDYFLTRLSFPHMLSPHNVPPGHGSFQAEVYFSKKYRPLDRSPEDCIEPVIADLKRCGLLREDDEIVFKEARLIPYANVIFDHERADALAAVHGYLDEVGVAYCGRYGEWGYHWTDESFKSGEAAAEKVLDNLGVGAGG